MSVAEVVVGFSWLFTVLSADSALTGFAPGGIRRALAPPGTATPFVIMIYQAGSDIITMNGYRLLVDCLFQVKAIGPASNTAAIASAAARIDNIIGHPPVSGSVAGGYVAASYRQSPIALDTLENGEEWTQFGGLYRLQIESY